MVQKKETKYILWMCEVCFAHYDEKKAAEKCEKQAPKRVRFKDSARDWDIGDIVALQIHDDIKKWRLARIIGEKRRDHKLIPMFEYLDSEFARFREYSFGFTHEEAILFTEKERAKVKRWAKRIKELECRK